MEIRLSARLKTTTFRCCFRFVTQLRFIGERVFALLKDMFGEDQLSALAD